MTGTKAPILMLKTHSILSRNALAHLLMLAVVFIWGSTFVLVKQALQDVSPQIFNTLRMAIAFVCLAVVYRKQWKLLTRRALGLGLLAGTCLAAGYSFQTAGLLYTTPTNSAFLTGLVVVLVPLLLAIPALRPPMSFAPGWNAWTGALVAFGGIVLLTTPAHTRWGLLLHSLNRGDMLTLGCALAFSLHVIVLAHAAGRVSFQQLALLQIGVATLLLGISTGALDHPYLINGPRVWMALLLTGILATAAAFSIQTWAQQVLPPTHLALLLTLEPVFAWLTSFLLLQERMEARRTLGALLVLAGILLTEMVRRPQIQLEAPVISTL
ncbi:MAG: DMT family transporter [Acidobacteriaceae bacterium]